MADQSVWQNALPEALGGAAITLLVIAYEAFKDSKRRNEEIRLAKFAAVNELREVGRIALALGESPDENWSLVPRITSLPTLIQLSLGHLGKPQFEAALAKVLSGVEECNRISWRLMIESTGTGRSMDNYDEVMLHGQERLKVVATELVGDSAAFINLIEQDK